jgi:5-dehydro-4-deoxyglucarate dehydratase
LPAEVPVLYVRDVSELDGVLFFPVTPFGSAGAVEYGVLAEHVRRGLDAGPGGIFAACGTGEFNALAPEEHERVVATAVTVAAAGAGQHGAGPQVPVFAGTGGPLPTAIRMAKAARDAGASGLLLLPPYLVQGPASGLIAYTSAVAAATDLPVIVYQRGSVVFDPAAAVEVAKLPTIIGFKDGLGDLDRLGQIVVAIRDALPDKPFQFFNGMPTAEVTVQAYRGIGVDLYSSAVFCFAPEVSNAFYRAVTTDDGKAVHRLLADFFHPLVRLRDKVPGYAVALVKAGIALRGLDAGGVRPPLADPSPEHVAELRLILDAGLAAAADLASGDSRADRADGADGADRADTADGSAGGKARS